MNVHRHLSVHEHYDLFLKNVTQNIAVNRPVTVYEDHHQHFNLVKKTKRSYYSYEVLQSDLFQRFNSTTVNVTRNAPVFLEERLELYGRSA